MGDPRFKNLELKVGFFILISIAMIFVMIAGFLVTQDVFTPPKVKITFLANQVRSFQKHAC